MTGGIFETFCFPVVLALCIWWFDVAQAVDLDAFVASGLDAFLARYNCFLWIPKVCVGTTAAGLDAFLASGLDAFLASYTCFLWIPKVTGGIFETFCFPVVLALCIWWFAVAQAAGLDAFVASGLDAFFASYNWFLWIPKVTGSILCWH